MKILYKPGCGEFEEKKSRFIGYTMPVTSEEEALEFIEKIRKKHWDARHNCFAYVIGDKQQIQRCSDDGEPSGTAGRPVLDVLLGEEIRDAVVVVTRYFGGTLLGTGGLVRAYKQGAKTGLEHSVVVEEKEGIRYQIQTDYNGIGKIQYINRTLEVLEEQTDYTDVVTCQVILPVEQEENYISKVTEATSGKAVIKRLESLTYGDAQGEVVVFEKKERS